MLHPEAQLPAALHKPPVQGDGLLGLCRPGEARAAAFQVGVQRELRHHQQGSAHRSQVQIHFAPLILEYPQGADFIRQTQGLSLGVLRADPQQHQKAPADLAVYPSVNLHRGRGHPRNHRPHA
ncbi:hypothetical protein SDC9_156414 [bioreactor metagenome]|uniref:Uncharacterized protein n=1 Tax=bioreactor metagenome TaxID=1076179 RepID=A0A645F673_9ZZZZ